MFVVASFFCGKPVPTFPHDALVIAQGSTNLKAVVGMIDDDTIDLPDAVRDIVRLYLNQIALLTQKIEELHFKLRAATKVDDAMRYRADLAS